MKTGCTVLCRVYVSFVYDPSGKETFDRTNNMLNVNNDSSVDVLCIFNSNVSLFEMASILLMLKTMFIVLTLIDLKNGTAVFRKPTFIQTF